MIIGSDFSRKHRQYLEVICGLSDGDTDYKVSVQLINEKLQLDRTELNILEYLQELGFIDIATIGGPLLYGHNKITEGGWSKCREISS